VDQFPLEKMVEKVGSRFAVVVAAAQRAKQIKDGSPPLVEVDARNPLTIALAEMAEGKVTVEQPEETTEEVNPGTLDQYFAGREDVVDEGLAFRRAARDGEDEGDALADSLDEDDYFDDEEDDTEEDE